MDNKRPLPPSWAIRTKADKRAIELGYYWDEGEAQRVIDWVIKYYDNKYGTFKLITWQERLLRSIFGWRDPDGNMRFSKVFCHTAKNNGKTTICAILTLYNLHDPRIKNPKVISGSTVKENARQIYDDVKHNIQRWEKIAKKKLAEFLDGDDLTIRVLKNGAIYKACSAQANVIEGENLSLGIIDEHSWHRGNKVYDAIAYNDKRAANSFIVSISTSGQDVTHPYFQLYKNAKAILAGKNTEDLITYCEVHEADPKADLENDKTQWRAANPSFGVSFTEKKFENELKAAKQTFAGWQNFKLRKLNLWINPLENIWLQPYELDALPMADYEDEYLSQYKCAFGFDGSQTEDPTALAIVWSLPEGRFYVRNYAYVCRVGFMKRESHLLGTYRNFEDEGTMVVTEGDRMDDERILQDTLELADRFRPIKMVFDPTLAWSFMGRVEEQGWEVERFLSRPQYFNEPMKQFEAAVRSCRIETPTRREYFNWSFQNIRLRVTKAQEMYPDSGRSVDHIDGAISSLQAFAGIFPSSHDGSADESYYDLEDATIYV